MPLGNDIGPAGKLLPLQYTNQKKRTASDLPAARYCQARRIAANVAKLSEK